MITPAGTVTDNDTGTMPWMLLANCRGVDVVLFHPDRTQSSAPAKAVCHACIVETTCLEYAMRNGERFGVWGGTSERERRRMRKERAQAAGTRQYQRIVA